MPRVDIPAGGFRPRPYQAEFMRFMDDGEAGRRKRAVLVWPRRSGKDLCVLHQTCKLALQRPGFYVYGLPTYNQARRVCWQGFISDGRPLLDTVFPSEVVKDRREADMTLKLCNGSLVQFVGADTIDRLVGTNPVGVVLSEMALCKPSVFDFLRPILAQNDGWFVGQSTPRGKNHFHTLFTQAKGDARWFASHKTVEETASMPMEAIQDEIRSGMDPALVRQEFWCDFAAATIGSVWGDLLEGLEKRGGLEDFSHETDGVFTSWDLGFSDSTAIWFWRIRGSGVEVVDWYEAHGQPLSHYLDVLETKAQERGYRYAKHWLPHDARARTLASGTSILEQVTARLGATAVAMTPHLSLLDGIQAGRWLLQQESTRIHPRCGEGTEALKAYRYDYDEDRKTFTRKPLHDWASHTSDAFRYVACAVRTSELLTRKEEKPKPKPVDTRQPTVDEMFAELHHSPRRERI